MLANVATLTNQTLVIVARYATQFVRFGSADHHPAVDGGVVRVQGSGVVELSPGWWDLLTIVDGTYTGPPFSGDTLSDTPSLSRYSWEGAQHASRSLREVREPISRPQTDEEYAAVVDPYRRFMHDVGVTSGPLEVDSFRVADTEFYGKTVEWTITSERAWIYGLTRELALNPALPTIVQDIPYNLVPYPSAELGSGSVVTATNLSTNPGVEVDATDWSATATNVSGTSPATFVTNGRSTDIGAGGSTASYRQRLLGNDGTTAVNASVANLSVQQYVEIPAGTNRRISLNLWAACLILNGSGPGTVVNTLYTTYEFYNGATTLGPAVTFSTATPTQFGGKAHTISGLAVPATATRVRVRAISNVTWSSSATAGVNSDIRLYGDSLTVSIP